MVNCQAGAPRIFVPKVVGPQEEAHRKITDTLSEIQAHLARVNNMGAVHVSPQEQLQHCSTVLEKVENSQRIFHEGAFRIIENIQYRHPRTHHRLVSRTPYRRGLPAIGNASEAQR